MHNIPACKQPSVRSTTSCVQDACHPCRATWGVYTRCVQHSFILIIYKQDCRESGRQPSTCCRNCNCLPAPLDSGQGKYLCHVSGLHWLPCIWPGLINKSWQTCECRLARLAVIPCIVCACGGALTKTHHTNLHTALHDEDDIQPFTR